jgi:CHAT domain-containing protein
MRQFINPIVFLSAILCCSYNSFAITVKRPSFYDKATSYKAQFKFDSAIHYFNASYTQAIATKNYADAIQSSLSLADMYYIAGTRKLALEQLERAKGLFLKNHLQNTENYAYYCDLMGKIYLDANAPDLALNVWQQSLIIRKRLYPENDIRLVRSYTNFLTYYYVLFDVKNSSKYVDTVTLLLSVNKNRLDSVDIPEVYNALARCIKTNTNNENHFEKYKITRQFLSKGISILSKKAPSDYNRLGQLFHTMANTYVDEIHYYKDNQNHKKAIWSLQKATYYYDLAISNFKKIFRDKHENISRSYFVKGLMHSLSIIDSNLVSIKWYRKAIETAMPINNSNDICESISNKEDLLQSIRFHEASLWKIYLKSGNQNNLLEAYNYAQKRVAIWEKMMVEFQSSYKNEILNIYGLNPLQNAAGFANELYKKTHKQEFLNALFILSEKSKYYSLQQSLHKEGVYKSKTKNRSLIAKYNQVLNFRNLLQEREMISYYSYNDKLLQKQMDSLKVTNIILSYFDQRLQNEQSDYYASFCRLMPHDISYIQHEIPDRNSAIVEYFILDSEIADYTISLTLTKDTFFTNTINWSKNDIISVCEVFQKSIQTSDIQEYSQIALKIYDTLFHPAISSLKNINRLIVIPDPLMTSIPFDGLISEAPKPFNKDYRKLKYLIHKYRISSQLSANMMLFLNGKDRPNGSTKGLFVSPEFKTKEYSKLPFSEMNIKELCATYSGKSLQKDEVTKNNFIKNSTNCNIIHLATHSSIKKTEPLKSKLLFSQYCAADSSNCLTLEDIYNTHFKADLVVLNACETNLGYFENGEGVINFPRAFLISGSKSVLSTLWKTDDQSSSELISSFYNELSHGCEKDEALRNAKLGYLKKATSSDDANPLYWASSIIIGNNQPIHISKRSIPIFWYYFGGIGLLALFIGFFLKKKKSL